MAFSADKRAVLEKYFGTEQVKEMEADTDRLKADLEKLGVSSKEVDDSVSLAEQLAALTKSMADGFAAVGVAIGTVRGEVAEAKKSLDDRVEEVLLPKVKAGAVEGPASSSTNLIDEKADKELVAATKSGDWLTPFVQNIERGL